MNAAPNLLSFLASAHEKTYSEEDEELCFTTFDELASLGTRKCRILAKEEHLCTTLREIINNTENERTDLLKQTKTLFETVDGLRRRCALLYATRKSLQESAAFSKQHLALEEAKENVWHKEIRKLQEKILYQRKHHEEVLRNIQERCPNEMTLHRQEQADCLIRLQKQGQQLQNIILSWNKRQSKKWNLWKDYVLRVAELRRSNNSDQTISFETNISFKPPNIRFRASSTDSSPPLEKSADKFSDMEISSSFKKPADDSSTAMDTSYTPARSSASLISLTSSRTRESLPSIQLTSGSSMPTLKLTSLSIPKLKMPSFSFLNKGIVSCGSIQSLGAAQTYFQAVDKVQVNPLAEPIQTYSAAIVSRDTQELHEMPSSNEKDPVSAPRMESDSIPRELNEKSGHDGERISPKSSSSICMMSYIPSLLTLPARVETSAAEMLKERHIKPPHFTLSHPTTSINIPTLPSATEFIMKDRIQPPDNTIESRHQTEEIQPPLVAAISGQSDMEVDDESQLTSNANVASPAPTSVSPFFLNQPDKLSPAITSFGSGKAYVSTTPSTQPLECGLSPAINTGTIHVEKDNDYIQNKENAEETVQPMEECDTEMQTEHCPPDNQTNLAVEPTNQYPPSKVSLRETTSEAMEVNVFPPATPAIQLDIGGNDHSLTPEGPEGDVAKRNQDTSFSFGLHDETPGKDTSATGNMFPFFCSPVEQGGNCASNVDAVNFSLYGNDTTVLPQALQGQTSGFDFSMGTQSPFPTGGDASKDSNAFFSLFPSAGQEVTNTPDDGTYSLPSFKMF